MPPYTSIMMPGLGSIGQAVPVGDLFADTFTDPNGTNWRDHKENVWYPTVVVSTSPDETDYGSISGNELTITADNYGAVLYSNIVNQHVEVDWTPSVDANNRNSILLRNDGGNGTGYMFNVRKDNGDVSIFKVSGGVATSLDTAAYTFNANQTYRIRAIADGSNLELYVNGVMMASTTDSTYTTNKFVGLNRNSGNSTATFDNFSVREVGTSTPDFAPSDISGLWCWLEAGNPGGTPGTWADLSGNGRDWTPGTAPTFNSGEVVFDGSTQYLDGPSMTGLSSATFLCFLKTNPAQSDTGTDTGLARLGTDGNDDHYPYGGSNYIGWGTASRPNVGSITGTDPDQWHNLSVLTSGSVYKVRTMREERYSNPQTTGFPASPRLGRSTTNYYFYGSMKAFIIYDKVLNTEELFAVESYIAGL